MTKSGDRWRRFLRLFDRTFFRMVFQFLIIIFLAFLLLIALGYYEASRSAATPSPSSVGFLPS